VLKLKKNLLGLEILEGLACDTDNCAEIIKVTNLVPKIIGLTSYNESRTDDAHALISSSLNLLRRLATRNGKIGVTLRQELWENPFLLSNLAGILENSPSCRTKVLKPAMDIIAIMAWDEVARHELGSVQVIIHKLVHVFIVGQDEDGSTNHDQSVRVAAGEALTNLAMGTANRLSISLFVWLWLIVNDRKFSAGIVFFSHTNQPAVLLHESTTI